MSLIQKIQLHSRSKFYVVVYDGIVSNLNWETRCSSSAASQIQWWVPTMVGSSSEISSEDQVCLNTGYDLMFRDIALAVLSCLGCR